MEGSIATVDQLSFFMHPV